MNINLNTINTSLEYAHQLDAQDLYAKYQQEFNYPYNQKTKENFIYLCGHSLGLQPKRSVQAVQQALDSWHKYGVEGHLTGEYPWLPYHEFITDYMAELVGANNKEVVCMNSLTANLHFMMVSFYKPTKNKRKILIENHAFPSDNYAVQSQINYHGYDINKDIIKLKARAGEYILRTEDILNNIEQYKDELALILLPGVQYYTGQVLDIKIISQKAKQHNITIGFDLAHAVGNIPLELHNWNVDFAVWCHYKYLNSGPGAVGGCFIHEKHVTNNNIPRFAGWWGHDKQTRFDMPEVFNPIHTAEAWQLSNPPIMSLASIRGSLSLFKDAGGIANLNNKTKLLREYINNLLLTELEPYIEIITPINNINTNKINNNIIGNQISIRFYDHKSQDINKILISKNIITDFRTPDVIRIAPVPLYNKFTDVWMFVNQLKKILKI